MKLVRVTCHLDTPAVLGSRWEHLDGLLHGATVAGRADRARRQPSPVPVYRLTIAGSTVHLASRLEVDGHVEEMAMVKRRDGIDVDFLAKRLHRGLGPGKDRLRRRRLASGSLSWLCVTGRKRPLRKLLGRLYCIGREVRAGFGRISRWVVEDVEESVPLTRCLVSSEGLSMRALPPAWCEGSPLQSQGSLNPPYGATSVDLVPPGAEVQLTSLVVKEVCRLAEVVPR